MTGAVSVDALIAGVLGREGGYVNNPADKGGPTNWGITQAVARAHGYPGDMRQLPRDEAALIYKRIYWLAPGLDAIVAVSPAVAAKLFDLGMNMGPPVGITFLQRCLNVFNHSGTDYPDLVTDGKTGPHTIAALTAYLGRRGPAGEGVLLRAINCLQGERYISLAESRAANEAFVYGWLANRVST